jgi:hypothetical protein
MQSIWPFKIHPISIKNPLGNGENIMTDTENTTPVATEATSTPEPKNENSNPRRGGRGEVGPHNIKGLYHSFQRREGRKSRGITLQAFAHMIAENGNDEEKVVALTWISNKSGLLKKKEREQRQKNKGAELAAIRQASKTKKGK